MLAAFDSTWEGGKAGPDTAPSSVPAMPRAGSRERPSLLADPADQGIRGYSVAGSAGRRGKQALPALGRGADLKNAHSGKLISQDATDGWAFGIHSAREPEAPTGCAISACGVRVSFAARQMERQRAETNADFHASFFGPGFS